VSKKKTHRPHGHYCKICGEYKANENFSGKGRAAHICKACSRLPAAEKTAAITINRLMNLPAGRLSASNKTWLENRLRDQRAEVATMAREVYNLHFPYAERNARKKQLVINSLIFEIHVKLPDIFGNDIPINKRFTANRSSRILTMIDFDTGSAEQSILLDSGRMAKLLRWAVHTLEIFMWPEDYSLLPETDLVFDLLEEDWENSGWENNEIFTVKDAQSVCLPEEVIRWRVDVEYSNHTSQEIISYQNFLEDCPGELYYAMLQYFEPKVDEDAEFE